MILLICFFIINLFHGRHSTLPLYHSTPCMQLPLKWPYGQLRGSCTQGRRSSYYPLGYPMSYDTYVINRSFFYSYIYSNSFHYLGRCTDLQHQEFSLEVVNSLRPVVTQVVAKRPMDNFSERLEGSEIIPHKFLVLLFLALLFLEHLRDIEFQQDLRTVKQKLALGALGKK
jgi:hypothetical protein